MHALLATADTVIAAVAAAMAVPSAIAAMVVAISARAQARAAQDSARAAADQADAAAAQAAAAMSSAASGEQLAAHDRERIERERAELARLSPPELSTHADWYLHKDGVQGTISNIGASRARLESARLTIGPFEEVDGVWPERRPGRQAEIVDPGDGQTVRFPWPDAKKPYDRLLKATVTFSGVDGAAGRKYTAEMEISLKPVPSQPPNAQWHGRVNDTREIIES